MGNVTYIDDKVDTIAISVNNTLSTEHPARVDIYALCCPDSGDIRYIGKADNAEKRLKSHIRDSRRRNTPVYCWIKSLALKGKIPVLKIIEVTDVERWQEVERRHIASYRAAGVRLLNVAEGGDQPHCTPEQRTQAGHRLNERLKANPRAKRMRELKTHLANYFRKAPTWKHFNKDHYNKLLAKAQERPDVFPTFMHFKAIP